MVSLAHAAGVMVVDDLGSGTLLDTSLYGMAREPLVQESVLAGADLVTFSGDKLLGGPAGGPDRGPQRAGQATPESSAGPCAPCRPRRRSLHFRRPFCIMCAARPSVRYRLADDIGPARVLAARAGDLAARLRAQGIGARVTPASSTVGGGSLPGEVLPGVVVALSPSAVDGLARRLRAGQPPVSVVLRVTNCCSTCETVLPEEDDCCCN